MQNWLNFKFSESRADTFLKINYIPRQNIYLKNFFLVFRIYFHWRIVTILWWFLQSISMNWPQCSCVSPSWTPLPPPSPPHPSGWSQSTDFDCLASCIELALVVYFTYGNMRVSVLFSQVIAPWPSPSESKTLFFTSLSLLLPCI